MSAALRPPDPPPPGDRKLTDSLRILGGRAESFAREFTRGLDRRELERLFDEDAIRAYSVLAGRRGDEERDPDEDDVHRFLRGAKDFFVGMLFKLSPGRRLLFAVSLFAPVLSMLDFWSFSGNFEGFSLSIDFQPFWFLVSISGLTLLLALELADRLRVRDELEVARQLQQELLPQSTPTIPGYRLAHSNRIANEIGGDYYDFIMLPDGRWALAVVDASGHGISAGLLMAISNAMLKTAVELDPSPSAVLDLLNRTLCRTGGPRAFVTAFYGVLDPSTGTLHYASGGHPFPLLRRADGRLEELGEGAYPLGIRTGVEYATHRVELAPGDLLTLYSDGLPEAVNPEDEAFGFERLRGLLELPGDPQSVHDRILRALDAHVEHRNLEDDMTLVLMLRVAPLPG